MISFSSYCTSMTQSLSWLFSISILWLISQLPCFNISANSFSGRVRYNCCPLAMREVVSIPLSQVALSIPICFLSYSCNLWTCISSFLISHCIRVTFCSPALLGLLDLCCSFYLSCVCLTSSVFSFSWSLREYFSLSRLFSLAWANLNFSSNMSLSCWKRLIFELKFSWVCRSLCLCFNNFEINFIRCLTSFFFEERRLPGSGNPRDTAW